MPLVIGIAVRDGLVVAADSRLYAGVSGGPPRLISDHVPRLYQLSKYTAVAYWGQALISREDGMVSISSAIANVIPDLPDTSFLDEAAECFARRMMIELGPDTFKVTGQFGFMFAGYDQNNVGRIVTVDLPDRASHEFYSTAKPGIIPQGYHRVITRILTGLDPELVKDINARPADDELKQKAASLAYLIPWPLLSLGDAAAIARTLIETTASVQRIALAVGGPDKQFHPDVGGPVDIVTVTRAGVHWVQRKPEYPAGFGR